ncbi:hypothetical protein RCL1_001018 [Eukaryota sp. TZLM3-RCL]
MAITVDQVSTFLQTNFPTSSAISAVVQLNGGLTNTNYQVTFAEDAHEPITVRFYGQNTEKVIDRRREFLLRSHLAKNGCAPLYHFKSETGDINQFIPGRCLDFFELPQHYPELSTTLANLHKVCIPQEIEKKMTVFETMRSWISTLRTYPTIPEEFDLVELLEITNQLEVEVNKSPLLTVDSLSICHNDLTAANVI